METSTSAASVFNLYQEGLAPVQVLQLCFLRRRAPRRLRLERTRIEDDFLLPRPKLQIASLLPPAARDSAKWHFLQPRQAAAEAVCRWSTLAESDWRYIHRSLQQHTKQQHDQDAETVGLAAMAEVPEITDICWTLEQCSSDAFVRFIWDHLLLSLLQQCLNSDTLTYHRLFSLLVTNRSLASLSPKDFRVKVRARNLRQVDDTLGAQAELVLIAMYRRQRDATN
ncbi:uncharacterized protein PITG_04602 [Phytophthora infestans T30-4]|uniref:Uncharacterized protein n=1 Tax=Phytophthora infestans (strain T30-4) TaxID=403677 RepID=D0N1L9_PHYIT|nr:uncharacterized protein PITG_04602 [Phytophthora infestans T30-4]EEY68198.1 conserved hypothetical protein [Phytophthora infestans T30-4]|eukprot:XP_002905357.1 conserved hypothetical protein [Phytophthora infestans T30-4]